ncbi:anthranilate synthase component I family protein [Gryllotalpicola protaetiae]|uniref:Anthranilate synthase component I family protein n=1 Tax=Gryllotalpicola protaetiae TaxID=2419771 RepID=A0A387BUB8_9MICO|nr:anthranilate synthase component I family protein [Gryllotalpicola protaetiae]AYG04680.1 anthranilate synthase component I family protein [Gryllotalpicola protaetiae]
MIERAATWVDPEAAFLALDRGSEVVWLDSGPDAVDGISVIGWPGAAARRLSARTATDVSPMLAALKADLAELLERVGSVDADRPVGSAKVGAGLLPAWAGWFSHEFGSALLGVPTAAAGGALAAMMLVERAVVFDHGARVVKVVAADLDGDWVEATLRALEGASAEASDPPAATEHVEILRAHDDAGYLGLIRASQAHIAAGDAYQLCLTEQWSAPRPSSPVDVYRRLRRLAPSHHGGYLRLGGLELLSASPERFVEVRDGVAATRPMKGTRPRAAEAAADAALAAELLASEKEQAENLMIVDLVRNDLSRVSELGSVTVDELFGLESYRTVHQLVSTVRGRLAPGMGATDAFAALFPAGSMTGAPKRRSVELLAELEGMPRGAYAGAFGYFAADGPADFATTIRTIVVDGDRATFGTGGGITASSEPEAELAEMKLKAAAQIAALGG